MYAKLRKQIEFEEGRRLHVYHCTAGHRTIGIGHNLDVKPNHHGSPIPDTITNDECDAIFTEDINEVITRLKRVWPQFTLLDDARRDAVANMAFQLGIGGVMKFKNMIACLTKQDWRGAYNAGLDSQWAKQTSARAKRVLTQILTGVYYE